MRNYLIGLILSTNMLAGCAQMAVLEATDQGRDPELVIASDLVNALMQVDGYHPTITRLQIQQSASRNGFGKTLNSVLASVGYDIEYVDSPMGDRFVQYTLSDHKNSAGSIPKTYHLSVGEVEFKRDYETIGGRVQPASNLLMAGVDPMTIKLNDQIFGLGASTESGQQPQTKQQSAPEQNNIPADSPSEKPELPLQHVTNLPPAGEHQVVEPIGSAIDLLVNGESSYQDPDGSVIRMYPNRFAGQSNIRAGELVHIPANDEWALQATRSGASDKVMCLSVEPQQEAVMSAFESAPDLEPLPVNSFDELLSDLKLQTGITPQVQRMSIRVN